MKKSLWILLAGLMLVLAACSSNGDGNKKDQSLLDKIKADKTITVGTEGTYAPFTFHDKDNKLTGYDVEVMREVAKRMGVKVDFKETQWDSMFEGLNSKRFDVVANQVGINDDRKKKYDFSVPYTTSSAVVVTAKDNDKVKSFKDIKGLKSAQSLTSNYGQIAKDNGAEVVGVEGLSQSVKLIESGRVDVTVNDKLAILDYLNQQKDAKVKIVAESPDASDSALLFRKGNKELVAQVDKELKSMKEDGTLAKISNKWFGEDVSK